MSKESFLPTGYAVPAGSGTDFMKFEDGDNRIRIMSAPVIGWEGWKDQKPFHREGVEKNISDDEVDNDDKFGTGKPKVAQFWAMVVWDYQNEKICVLQLKQKTIMKAIQEYSEDEEWGNPTGYDITITKKKEGEFVKYSVKPSPAKAVKASIEEAFEEAAIDLQDVFFGEKEDDDAPVKGKGMKNVPGGKKKAAF